MNKTYERYIKNQILESFRKVKDGKSPESEVSELFEKIKLVFD